MASQARFMHSVTYMVPSAGLNLSKAVGPLQRCDWPCRDA